jgi:hypothetical protein
LLLLRVLRVRPALRCCCGKCSSCSYYVVTCYTPRVFNKSSSSNVLLSR